MYMYMYVMVTHMYKHAHIYEGNVCIPKLVSDQEEGLHISQCAEQLYKHQSHHAMHDKALLH